MSSGCSLLILEEIGKLLWVVFALEVRPRGESRTSLGPEAQTVMDPLDLSCPPQFYLISFPFSL